MEYINARVPEWPRGQAAGVETQQGMTGRHLLDPGSNPGPGSK